MEIAHTIESDYKQLLAKRKLNNQMGYYINKENELTWLIILKPGKLHKQPRGRWVYLAYKCLLVRVCLFHQQK